MIRSFYTSVTSLITQEKKQNTILNNISNANTTSFKKDEIISKSFKEVFVKEQSNSYKNIGKISLGSSIDEVSTLYTQGNLKETNKNLNFAIEGRGFFVVGNENNKYYTRDGNFVIDNQGYLKTTDGNYVLGINKVTNLEEPIYIGDSEFKLEKDNSIWVNDTSNYYIKTADFDDYNLLTKVGNNYYTGGNEIENTQVDIKQGYLEESNINIVEEMTDMMTTMRNFETNQKIVQMLDEIIGKAATEIGRI